MGFGCCFSERLSGLPEVAWLGNGVCSREQGLHFLTHQPEPSHSANFFRGAPCVQGKNSCPQSERALASGRGRRVEQCLTQELRPSQGPCPARADWRQHHECVSRGIRKPRGSPCFSLLPLEVPEIQLLEDSSLAEEASYYEFVSPTLLIVQILEGAAQV